jgi:hypothetical protein
MSDKPRFFAKGKEVILPLYSVHENHVVATCYNDDWAEHIAGLLSADYETTRFEEAK